MDQQPEIRSRVQSDSKRFFILLLLVTAFLTGCFYLYDKARKNEKLPGPIQNVVEQITGKTESTSKNSHPPSDSTPQIDSLASSNTDTSAPPQETSVASELVALKTADSPVGEKVTQQGEALDSNPAQTSFDVAPYIETPHSETVVQYEPLVQELNSFYTHLDSQPYMAEFKLEAPSKTHFSELIQKLLDNPPVVTRETDDLFTLLKNTAHFFRILGKDNVMTLKGILDRERDSFEDILKCFYTLTYSPEHLQTEYAINLDQNALHDYAAFFLHTMGGRLYLFRRDSTSRLAVSFYAILIIDRANDSGNSPHGIDIRPPVNSLIEEIENGGKNLKMRDEYLDKLYTLKEKYGSSR